MTFGISWNTESSLGFSPFKSIPHQMGPQASKCQALQAACTVAQTSDNDHTCHGALFDNPSTHETWIFYEIC